MCLALLGKSVKEHLWEIQKGGTQRLFRPFGPDKEKNPCLTAGAIKDKNPWTITENYHSRPKEQE